MTLTKIALIAATLLTALTATAQEATIRKNLGERIPQLQKIDKQKQGSVLNQLFFTAKADEMVNILSSADTQDKLKAYDVLSEIDPSNSSKYETLKKTR